jgi:hypothetical protein
MLLSEMILIMQEAMAEQGDQEVNMWVDSGEDTQYPVRIKQVELNILPMNEYDDYFVLQSERNSFFLYFGNYNESEDSLYDEKVMMGIDEDEAES